MAKYPLVLFLCCTMLQPLRAQVRLCIPGVQEHVASRKHQSSIRQVLFENAPELPARTRREALSAVQNRDLSEALTDEELQQLTDEVAERVRAAYQDEGYFKADIEGKSIAVPALQGKSYDIEVRVVDRGGQYRLGELTVIKSTQFSAQQLRDLFPIADGEVFSRRKIAQGLENIRRLYDSRGYIDFTAVPNATFDVTNAIANLSIDVDEGKQFHTRNIAIIGVDAEKKIQLLRELSLKPGDVYTPNEFDRLLPNVRIDDPWVMNKRIDEREGTVDVVIDLRPKVTCPPPTAPCEVNGKFQSCSDWF